ncbi:hypothetical protein NGB36_14845 [Streptomyces sp. RB6PN25]|uniref:Uncharacterized protein n=1 Tax=Streptomyces humicola TaxID=2953240 RepID=A0ABT1PVZ9_9ACTN|nr:hypothetical protein [Streptomyces humicola]MCQ4081851.1 hypothetical protein [Streptomyces humicola]
MIEGFFKITLSLAELCRLLGQGLDPGAAHALWEITGFEGGQVSVDARLGRGNLLGNRVQLLLDEVPSVGAALGCGMDGLGDELHVREDGEQRFEDRAFQLIGGKPGGVAAALPIAVGREARVVPVSVLISAG